MARYFERTPDYPYGQRVHAVDTGRTTSWGAHPSAYISYHRGKIHPNFETYGDGSYEPTSEWEDARRNGYAQNADRMGNPTTLFHVKPPHVVELFSDPSMRPHVATLLGHVLNHAQMLGTKVEASDDLSPHSSRLVRRGIQAGLVKGDRDNPEGNVTNNYGFSDTHIEMDDIGPHYSYQEMSPEKVKESRKAGREAIKALKGKPRKKAAPKKSAPQGEQLRLDI